MAGGHCERRPRNNGTTCIEVSTGLFERHCPSGIQFGLADTQQAPKKMFDDLLSSTHHISLFTYFCSLHFSPKEILNYLGLDRSDQHRITSTYEYP
ncbi:MAG: hypothetical protein KatS3mg029_0598 [Saprospiraceae bacterium]|nr:MAG: hypothetical protein KatS3mg029_0598 [Saprospiraceae bacterium]